jgi:hypothetical protein
MGFATIKRGKREKNPKVCSNRENREGTKKP